MDKFIFLVDDHELVREGIRTLIEKKSDYKVVGEANSGVGLIDQLQKTKFDLLLLDLSMPGKNGLVLIKELKKFFPEIKILILTMHPEERFAFRCLRAGAKGYLTKSSAARELIKALDKILDGRKYISEELAENLAFLMNASDELPHQKLSDREYQVFILLAQGKGNFEISNELNLSPSTINTYRNRIKEKTNMESIAEIVRYSIENNLIE